ncbi:unnamed protein product [Sphagnum jensenii]|uniref:Uncharacterized protein n=1 Tax=Sphagnum jensenii TaxID=128206 RepID=A0ABP0VZJ6_9BRYO
MMEDANGPLAHDQGTQFLEGMLVNGLSRMVTMGIEEFATLIKYVVQAELAVARQERVELQVGQPLYVEAPATDVMKPVVEPPTGSSSWRPCSPRPPLQPVSSLSSQCANATKEFKRLLVDKEIREMTHLPEFHGCSNVSATQVLYFLGTLEEFFSEDYTDADKILFASIQRQGKARVWWIQTKKMMEAITTSSLFFLPLLVQLDEHSGKSMMMMMMQAKMIYPNPRGYFSFPKVTRYLFGKYIPI